MELDAAGSLKTKLQIEIDSRRVRRRDVEPRDNVCASDQNERGARASVPRGPGPGNRDGYRCRSSPSSRGSRGARRPGRSTLSSVSRCQSSRPSRRCADEKSQGKAMSVRATISECVGAGREEGIAGLGAGEFNALRAVPSGGRRWWSRRFRASGGWGRLRRVAVTQTYSSGMSRVRKVAESIALWEMRWLAKRSRLRRDSEIASPDA